ncbi:MAG: hypothetical protein LQ342_004659 [Letrouitia transgressa]|nr:MAG: hypothetical protein LQ342_004659 [Letrouitia transgressa]
MARSERASSPEAMDIDSQSDFLETQSLVRLEGDGSRGAYSAFHETQQPQEISKNVYPSVSLGSYKATALSAEDAAGIKTSGRPTTQGYHHQNAAQSERTDWNVPPIIEETREPQDYPSSGTYSRIRNTIKGVEKNNITVERQTTGGWLPPKRRRFNTGNPQDEKSRKPLPAPIEKRRSARLDSLVPKPCYNENHTKNEGDELEYLLESVETRSTTPIPPPQPLETRQDSEGKKRKPQRLVLRPPKPPGANDDVRSAPDDPKRRKVTPSALTTGSPGPIAMQNASSLIEAPVDARAITTLNPPSLNMAPINARPIATQNASSSFVAPVNACATAIPNTPSSITAPVNARPTVTQHASLSVGPPLNACPITMPWGSGPPLSVPATPHIPSRRGRPPLSATARPSIPPRRGRPPLRGHRMQDASLSSSLSRSDFPRRLPAPASAPGIQPLGFERFKQPRFNSIPTAEALANRRLFFHTPWVLNDTRLCFLGLPRPIRRKIYILCLSGGKFHPFARSASSSKTANRKRAGGERPTVALLRTCKLVFMEAEPVLYGYNTFCLHTVPALTAFLKMMRNPVRRSWIRSVETSVSAQDMTSMERDLVVSRLESEGGRQGLEKEKRLHHAVRRHLAHVTWPKKLKPILAMKLEYLFVDLTEASCERGCCYLNAHAMIAFNEGFEWGLPKGLRVKVLGSEIHTQEPAAGMLLRWLMGFQEWRERKVVKLVEGVGWMGGAISGLEIEEEEGGIWDEEQGAAAEEMEKAVAHGEGKGGIS